MKITQLHICLFMWFEAIESLTNIAVTLGADVNITCDLDIEEIYWYRQKSPDPPVLILRTFDRTVKAAKYENSIITHKYSVKPNSSLFIVNISTDELAVYYCVKTREPFKFNNGTKIYITGLGKSYIQTRTKTSSDNRQSNTAVQYSVDSQYAGVNLPTPPTENRHCEETSLYSLLQPIRPV
ncbi:uncharacterized protein LOC130216712 isoform X3 [Danio aesculapii]|uniref:uncharacterized protein LOC130216712 isoform X3 n=1 Tax=Danio aesculapii TaxID=1142201 RepID=UPI0024BF4879|nr:uncharacterized protein LOC130216712 isoform X3 [Danio aesculapii]